MKLRTLLLVTALVSIIPLCTDARADAPDTPLEIQMQALARGTKKLSLQVSDPTKQQDTVSLLESLKQTAAMAKTLEPRKTASIASADRAQFLAAYQSQMDKLTAAYDQIETSVKAGQYDQAKSILSTLGPIKKEGHSKFKQD